MKTKVGRNPIFWILLTAPLALLLLCQLQPTFDDWTYYTIPQTEPFRLQSLLPDGNYWRPFDVLFGHLLGLNYRLFPFLNHLFILLGHILNTWLVYRILQWFRVSTLSRNLSVVFFHFIRFTWSSSAYHTPSQPAFSAFRSKDFNCFLFVISSLIMVLGH